MKQPRVPEYREADGVQRHLKALTLFLKDFCMDVWTADRNTEKGLSGIKYPVTSVNQKTGDVTLGAKDVGALPEDAAAKDSEKLGGEPASQYAKKSDIPEDTGVDFLSIYPVGSIYMSVSSASPASLFGGSWERIQGRFLLGAGAPSSNSDSYFGAMSGSAWNAQAGSTGGQDYHVLTNNEMPSHTHAYYLSNGPETAERSALLQWVSTATSSKGWQQWFTDYSGSSLRHNNMPPYLAVYMWKRVS